MVEVLLKACGDYMYGLDFFDSVDGGIAGGEEY
jgi:hypothetical protein